MKQVDASSYSIAQGICLSARLLCLGTHTRPRSGAGRVQALACARTHIMHPWVPGFVDNMNVPGHFYVNQEIKSLLFDELKQFSRQVRRECLSLA